MSKYGYYGGFKRPVEKPRGDPEGPSLAELQRREKEILKNYDPRFGGSAFRKAQPNRNPIRTWIHRNPRLYIFIFTTTFCSIFFGLPLYEHRQQRLAIPKEESDAYHAAINRGLDEKFGKTGLLRWLFR